ncbi:MAG: FIST C-terminal domain-containing protein, partial [Burkholderiales bacterium]|nr:FIST C-terminal domain-containing protein [Burkholderiales bacterium]
MPEFSYAHAAASTWQDAADACLTQLDGTAQDANLGFLYITDYLADDTSRILAYLKQHSSVRQWTGAVGIGICASGREYLDQPALAVMLGTFDKGSFRIFSGLNSAEDLGAPSMNRALKCGSAPANFAVVHGDPANAAIAEIILELTNHIESGFVVGGLTSSRRRNVQIANRALRGGASGVLFASEVVISTRLTQGCTPIAKPHTITGCQRNLIMTLDDRPALDVFMADIGDTLASDLNRVGGLIFAGLPIPGSERPDGDADYLVRNLVGIDPTNKIIAIGDWVAPGMSMMFCRRDRAAATLDMQRMLTSIKSGLYGKPKGGLYYS